MDAVTSADMAFMASNPAASAPNPGTPTRIDSMNPAQNRTGSASALSQDSHDVTPGDLASAQVDSNTLLPAPADPTTTVSRWPASTINRSTNADRVTKVVGSVVGRNFARANRRMPDARSAIALSVTAWPPRCLPEPMAYVTIVRGETPDGIRRIVVYEEVTGSSGRGREPQARRWDLATLPSAEFGHIIHCRMRSLPRTSGRSGFQVAPAAGPASPRFGYQQG